MDLKATKPVFGVSDRARLKPVSFSYRDYLKIKISPVAISDILLSKKQITKALISLHGCAGWSVPLLFTNPKTDFLVYQTILIQQYIQNIAFKASE